MNNHCLNLHFSLFRQCLPLLPWRKLQGQQWWQRWWVVHFQCSDSSSVSSGCCKSVTLKATGAAAEWWSYSLGRYASWGHYHEGGPVFRKSDGWYLYRHSDGTWHVGESYNGGTVFIRSVGTAQCPVSVSQWQYWADGPWHSGDIRVQCSF